MNSNLYRIKILKNKFKFSGQMMKNKLLKLRLKIMKRAQKKIKLKIISAHKYQTHK